jgi:hypothetical protein
MKILTSQYRIKHPLFGYGNDKGAFFVIPHHRIVNYFFNCMVSTGEGWEHVSISLSTKTHRVDRCPTWDEMCWIKDFFWKEDECVVQYHPPKTEYVSNHPYCLHLWRPTNKELVRPNPLMVGIPGVNIQH